MHGRCWRRYTIEMARTVIFPAAVRYQNELASTCTNLKANGYSFDTDTLDAITALVKKLQDGAKALEKVIQGDAHGSAKEKTRFYADQVVPAMQAVRQPADALEQLIADDLWPLPTYQEMLFIK